MSIRLALAPNPSGEVLETAGRLLRQGGILAVPTESYYALGACPFDEEAVRRLCRIKGRGEDKPILVLIGDRAQLSRLVIDVPPAAQILMDRLWPCALTLIFRAAPHLSPELTKGTGTIGIRQPAREDVRALLRHVGPLTGTSANRTGHPPVRTAQEVTEGLGEDVDLILDGGRTPGGLPSTLVDVTGPIRVLREGPTHQKTIRAVLMESGIRVSEQPL